MRISNMRDLIDELIPEVKDVTIDLPKLKNEMTEEDWFYLAKEYVLDLVRDEHY